MPGAGLLGVVASWKNQSLKSAKLSDRNQEIKGRTPTERWRYAGLPVYETPKISLTDAVGGASSSDVGRCLGTKDRISVVDKKNRRLTSSSQTLGLSQTRW